MGKASSDRQLERIRNRGRKDEEDIEEITNRAETKSKDIEAEGSQRID